MASSSENPNGVDKIIHIQSTLVTLLEMKQILNELKGSGEAPASSSNDRGPEKAKQCEKLCKELDQIVSVFRNIELFGGKAVDALSRLDKKVRSVSDEINGAKEPLADDQYQKKLRSVASSIADLKVLLPSVRKMDPDDLETAKHGDAGKGLTFHNDLPAKYMGKTYGYDSTFTELLEGLDDQARQMLLLFAVFPAGTVINKRVLKNWWHGEGLLGRPDAKSEDIANQKLEELMRRCLIEAERKDYRLVGFKMRPFVHFAVVMAAAKTGFFAFDSLGYPTVAPSRSSRICLVSAKAVESSLDVLEKTPDLDLYQLQTLFNINEQYPDFKLESFLKLKNLKVVSLGQWQSGKGHHIEVENTEFLKGLKSMKHVRLLSLRGMSRVFDLPDEVCKLGNLEILDLKACHNLENLPEEIGSLKKLIHLDISQCYLLDKMPKGIALLTELQILKGFLVLDTPDASYCTFNDLAGLKNLRKLSVHANRSDFPGSEDLDTFQKFEQLEKLSISWGVTDILQKTEKEAAVDPHTAPSPAEMAEIESERRAAQPRKHMFAWFKKLSTFCGMLNEKNKKAAADPHDAPSAAENAEMDPETSQPMAPSDGIHEVQIEDAKAEELIAGDHAYQTDKAYVFRGKAVAESAPQTLNSAEIVVEPNSTNQSSREANLKSGLFIDQRKDEDVLERNSAKGGAEETVKTLEITEEAGAPTDGESTRPSNACHIVETGDGTTDPQWGSPAKSATSKGSDLQHGIALQPEGTENQANGGRGVKQEGRMTGTLIRKASMMVQKKMARALTLKQGPKLDQTPKKVEIFKSLQKLDLQCYPLKTAPDWLNPEEMKKLKKLYIRGGSLCSFVEGQSNSYWTVEVIRLKYLTELSMKWEVLLGLFPKLIYLEIEGCDCQKLTSCPSDPNGVWVGRTNTKDGTAENSMEKFLKSQ